MYFNFHKFYIYNYIPDKEKFHINLGLNHFYWNLFSLQFVYHGHDSLLMTVKYRKGIHFAIIVQVSHNWDDYSSFELLHVDQ